MGFSFKRAAKFASGGYALGKIGDAVSGPKARAMGQFDQRGVGEVTWDPRTGMPIGLNGAIDPQNALAYQQHANELVATRNQGRRDDAAAFLEQATTQSQTFRQGGYATLGSGLWAQRAQLAANDQIEAPDMLAGYREQKGVDAANAARRAAKMNFAGGLLQAGIPLLAGLGGGAAPALAAASQAGQASQMGAPGGGGYDDGMASGGAEDGGMAESGGAGGMTGGGFDPYAYANRAETAFGSSEFDDAYSSYTKKRMRSF